MSGVNPATFLKRIDGIITGSGFKRVIQGVNINTVRADGGLILTGSTNPKRLAVETSFDALVVTNAQTDLGRLVFQVPRDYDQSLDYLRLRFLAESAGDTDTPTIDAAIYLKRKETALSSDLDPTISSAVNNNTTGAGWVEVNADGLDLRPGDALNIELTTSAHTTDSLHVYGLEAVYKSDLVYFEKSER
jgi:hypothetical protein